MNNKLSIVTIVAILAVALIAAVVVSSYTTTTLAKQKVGFHGCDKNSKAFIKSHGKCFHEGSKNKTSDADDNETKIIIK
jgi:hypothetical protein